MLIQGSSSKNHCGKNKLVTVIEQEVIQNFDWDEDKFEQIKSGM